MNTYARSLELDALAADVLAALGLEYETDFVKLRPAVNEFRARSGIQIPTARKVIARHLRKTRGLVVRSDGNLYRVIDVSTLPHPADAEPIPLVLVAPMVSPTEGG